jgi:hypothetical protein
MGVAINPGLFQIAGPKASHLTIPKMSRINTTGLREVSIELVRTYAVEIGLD